MVPFGYYEARALLFCLTNGKVRISGQMTQEPGSREREKSERSHESQDIHQDRKERRLARVVHDELSAVRDQFSALRENSAIGTP
jgi:hypothetical protein